MLNHWYGLGTDPGTISSPVANPGVWSEVALGYRELLEGPGQQIAQLISALQQVDPPGGRLRHAGRSSLGRV